LSRKNERRRDDHTLPEQSSETAAANLKQAGAEVKDEDLAYTILAGLPNTYENLHMTLASLPDDKFISAEIIRAHCRI